MPVSGQNSNRFGQFRALALVRNLDIPNIRSSEKPKIIISTQSRILILNYSRSILLGIAPHRRFLRSKDSYQCCSKERMPAHIQAGNIVANF
jgi:hypothetical protein